jgi:signal transduction histidine kinase
MKIAAAGLGAASKAQLAAWGWQITDQDPDAILTEANGVIELRVHPAPFPDDFVFLPLGQQELQFRIEAAQARHARLAKRLHDLRSPLNAIQGYAEIIAESADGDVLRFASNICTASELLANRLAAFRDEGV